MFKKLKDKIAEEVKQSPQRIQQIAQAAQAAVSSASSSTSEISGSDNFFSITEEDTPQNSPHRRTLVQKQITSQSQTNLSNASPNPVLLNNGIIPTRQRKLSNSSMASDVSFRLPSYESPAVYHLQSDLDASASEFEDLGSPASNAQLELISKEQLHSAYRKALDRYHKYRNRYTELARRYRDLERDNNKARGVLVETQDKALRRISELREQCSLEQQAKAHLEAALRLEIDEMQCVIKTLKTKLTLLGENPEAVLQNEGVNNGASEIHSTNNESLIDLSDEGVKNVPENLAEDTEKVVITEKEKQSSQETTILNEKIKKLEEVLNVYKQRISDEQHKHDERNEEVKVLEGKVKQLNENLNESIIKIKELQTREEENTILLAENKLMVHSELENKETEVKTLHTRLQQFENDLKQSVLEKEKLQEILSTLKKQIDELNNQKQANDAKMKDLESMKNKICDEKEHLNAKLNDLEKNNLNMEKEKYDLLNKISESEKIITDLKGQFEDSVKRCDQLQIELEKSGQISNKNVEKLEGELLEYKTQISLTSQELQDVKSKCSLLENEIVKNRENQVKLEVENKTFKDDLLHLSKSMEELKTTKDGIEKTKTKLEEKTKKLLEEKKRSQEVNKENQLKIGTFNNEIKQLRDELSSISQQKNLLTEEIKSIKLMNENSESEALKSMQDSMKNAIAEMENKLKKNSDELNNVISEKMNEVTVLTEKNQELSEKIDNYEKSGHEMNEEILVLRNKVDSLKNEKRDLEKTLEKEIRDKSELKTQVTNILQEIGRLEEQLKEVKNSHSIIQTEKITLEEKIEKLQKQSSESKAKYEKDQIHKWQAKVKDFELKVQQIQCENSQLAEKNCLLEESNSRLQNNLKECETNLKRDKNTLNETIKQLESKIANSESERVELETAKDTIVVLNEKLSQCVDENTKLLNAKELLEHEFRSLQDENEAKDKEKLCVLDSNNCLQEELAQLNTRLAENTDNIKLLEIEKNQLTAQCDNLQKEIEKIRGENDLLRQEKQHLEMKYSALENEKQILSEKNEVLNKEIDNTNSKNQSRLIELENMLKRTNDEKQTLKESIKNATDLEKKLQNYEDIKIENEYLNTLVKQLETDLHKANEEKLKQEIELKELKDKIGNVQSEIYVLQESKSKVECLVADKDAELDQLKVNWKTLQMEHNKLKQELESAIKSKQTEVKNWSDKYSEETKQLKTEINAKQIIISDLNKDIENLERQCSQAIATQNENKILKDKISELEENLTEAVNVKTQTSLENTNTAQQLKTLSTENASLVKLNEGLTLKLNELETMTNGKISNLSQEIDELLDTNRVLKDKQIDFEKLQQQHMAITEENTQLREQINSNDSDDNNYDSLLTEKRDLDNKLKKILSEVQDVSNRNLFLEQKCENYLILEQSNERLKLSNEKLLRQLDEALVTRQHHEGLEANTEFEYLKNIMFQYLSGNVHGNNNPLVKVIAAVLKFSPQQTQVVLEKETQRHTLMGQLNNLL